MMDSGYAGTGRRLALLLATMVAALLLSGGMALAATIACQSGISCYGTADPDTLEGNDGNNTMFGRGGADTLLGRGGNDHLDGDAGGDSLFGGPGNDHLFGDLGKDDLRGGGGSDEYHFYYSGWGHDSITDGTASLNGANFSIVTEPLTIRLTAGAGPEAKNESGSDTVEWESGVIDLVVGGQGDDDITGSLSTDAIYANIGADTDTVSARGGDDYVWVNDGSGGDSVDCGEDLIGGADNDWVFYDSGDTVTNCETKEEGVPGGA